MLEFFQLLEKGVETLGSKFWIVASAAAALGALSMAVLQTLKDLLPVRQIFHRKRINAWLEKHAKESPHKVKANATQAENDLILLATAGDVDAFYDLPLEQLCGQMNSALQVALDFPEKYGNLLWCVAHLCDEKDRNLLAPVRKELKELLEKARKDLKPEERDVVDEYAAARSRVAHQMQRAIDGLQIAEGFRWKQRMQWMAILLSIMFAMVAYAMAAEGAWAGDMGRAIVLGILAGFLAPVSRDLVAALERFRKR